MGHDPVRVTVELVYFLFPYVSLTSHFLLDCSSCHLPFCVQNLPAYVVMRKPEWFRFDGGLSELAPDFFVRPLPYLTLRKFCMINIFRSAISSIFSPLTCIYLQCVHPGLIQKCRLRNIE